MNNKLRLEEHKKNANIETTLKELEDIFSPIEEKLVSKLEKPEFPIVFIVGCARSGTTLLYQYLANLGIFAFPNNLISRFYFAPYIGSKLSQLLIDFDDKGEIFNSLKKDEFKSNLGKTLGANSPHEFWYFWKRFFEFGELQQLDEKILENVDKDIFLKELSSIQKVYQKPLLMKGMIMNWHIPYLVSLSDNIFFIYMNRDIAYNAQSLLLARQTFFGTMDHWYSFKPKEYNQIKNLQNEDQVVYQVHYTNKAIEQGLSQISSNRYCTVNYENFCQNPNLVTNKLMNILNMKFQKTDKPVFKTNKSISINQESWKKILHCIDTINS